VDAVGDWPDSRSSRSGRRARRRTVAKQHVDDDHGNGNGIYREAFPGVVIVAHANTRTDHIEQTIAV
jgi:hypothetical protein